MKKRTYGVVFSFSLAILLFGVPFYAYSDDKGLSAEVAKDVITRHCKVVYGLVALGDKQLSIDQKEKFDAMVKHEKLYSDLGLIEINLSQSHEGLVLHIKTTLTETGQKYPHVFGEDDDEVVGFVVGERSAFDIVMGDRNTGEIYFSFQFNPNELGKKLVGSKIEKFRGKAKVVFDPSVKDYTIKELFWSPWERGHWEKTTWAYEAGGKTVLKNVRKQKDTSN